MPLRAARVGRVGVIGHPVAKTAVVAKAVTPVTHRLPRPRSWPRPSPRAGVCAGAGASDRARSRSVRRLLWATSPGRCGGPNSPRNRSQLPDKPTAQAAGAGRSPRTSHHRRARPRRRDAGSDPRGYAPPTNRQAGAVAAACRPLRRWRLVPAALRLPFILVTGFLLVVAAGAHRLAARRALAEPGARDVAHRRRRAGRDGRPRGRRGDRAQREEAASSRMQVASTPEWPAPVTAAR